MPDPWVTGDALKEHEKAVQDHELTKLAKKLRDQEESLVEHASKADERAEEDPNGLDLTGRVKASPHPAADTGYSEEVASGGQGTLGEATAPEPAGNVDSDQPTQEELEKEQRKQERAQAREAKKNEAKNDS